MQVGARPMKLGRQCPRAATALRTFKGWAAADMATPTPPCRHDHADMSITTDTPHIVRAEDSDDEHDTVRGAVRLFDLWLVDLIKPSAQRLSP